MKPPGIRELSDFRFETARTLWTAILRQARTDWNATATQSMDGDYQGAMRVLWSLGAWFSRPRRENIVGGIHLGEWLSGALRAGTDPQNPDCWPVGRKPWDQMVVEAPQVGWALWCLERGQSQTACPFSAFDKPALENIHEFLRAQDDSLYPHNWSLFVVSNHEVRCQMHRRGVPGFLPGDRSLIDGHLRAVLRMHAGGGWFSDSSISPETPTFDDYNAWGYALFLLQWLLYTHGDPDAEGCGGIHRDELSASIGAFLAQQPLWWDSTGAHVEYGRSLTYKFARLSALVFAYALERFGVGTFLPKSIRPGLIRRLIRLHLNHYIRAGALDPATGILGRGITDQKSPELLEGYLSPGSTCWCMSLFGALWLLDDQDPFWSAPEEVLPAERGSFAVWNEPTGFLIHHHEPSGHVELFNTRVHKTTGNDLENKYEKFVYSSAFGFCTRSGSRTDQNLSIGGHWRREILRGSCLSQPGDPATILFSEHRQADCLITSWILIREGVHVRIHLLAAMDGTEWIREGSYALGLSSPGEGPEIEETQDGILCSAQCGSIFTARLHGFTSTKLIRGEGRHSRYSRWLSPCHETPQGNSGLVLASLHASSRNRLNSEHTHVIGRRFSPACYIADAMPASLYLVWKYHNNFDAGVVANAMVGGDNCHRGAVVGSLLAAANGVPGRWRAGLAASAELPDSIWHTGRS